MKNSVFKLLFACSVLCGILPFSHAKMYTKVGDFECTLYGLFKPEFFFGKNVSLLNNNNKGNSILYARHTLDVNLDVAYGSETYNARVAEFLINIRNRGLWGNASAIAPTTDAETKLIDSVARLHRHAIPRHIFWIRESWLACDVAEFLGISLDHVHSFKLGLFPFQLGRGIALGDAYAVGPEILGFYSDSVVDQFAPGGLLHGELISKKLYYDLYVALLQNKSSSLSDTGAAIVGQEFGRRKTPQRGSGIINFVVATRLACDMFHNEKLGLLHVEPYILYNHDPEQKVEFFADASNRLATLGFALEYSHEKFDFGFDYALNMGQQRVKGWDRNQVEEKNRDGTVVLVNNHVVDQNGNNIPFIAGGQAQTLIDTSFQNESQNGKIIGTVDANVGYLTGPITVQNSNTRFRNPFINKYEGWMFVADGGIWAHGKDLRLTAMAGIATGDENPNNETKDGVYSGFIGLQEVYSGDRVKSAFLLGGSGRLKRPLSDPISEQAPSKFAQAVDGFTNLVFAGLGFYWEPVDRERPFRINPNVITYWQESPTKKFDAQHNTELDCFASTHLGTELNLFAHCMMLQSVKLFFVGAVFFPGAHYRDVKGKPLTSAQKKLLDELDVTGFSQDRIPNLGDDIAYTFNLGLEFKF